MQPPQNETGRLRANAIDPEKGPDQEAVEDYAAKACAVQEMRDTPVGSVRRDRRSEVRVRIRRGGNGLLVDIRRFDFDGRGFRETAQGFSLPPGAIGDLLDLLAAARRAAQP